MLNAVEQFFPDSGILQDEAVGLDENTLPPSQSTRGYPLHRVNTGASSLVGHNNGDRPGGFVLVIDGAALTYVRNRKTSHRGCKIDRLITGAVG